MDKTSRAVIPRSRLFNTLFGLPRSRKNTATSLGTIQSGSPPDGCSLYLCPPGSWILTPDSSLFVVTEQISDEQELIPTDYH